MTFNDCSKLVNELKSTVGGKEFQAFIRRFVKNVL